MTLPPPNVAQTILAADMVEPNQLTLGTGPAVVYSIPNPVKQSGNEDGVLLLTCGERRGIIAIADGFGGQPGGDRASGAALAALSIAIQRVIESGGELREGILNGFEEANRAVCALAIGAATTLVVVEVDGPAIRSYHVGDSAALVAGQRGRLRFQTVAHSPVGYAVESGFMEEREALLHEDRHIVSNVVGAADMRIDIGPVVELKPRDTLLVASDGLFDNMHLDEIIRVIRKGPLPEAVRALAEATVGRMAHPREGQPSKPDDLTIVAYRTGTVARHAAPI